ncbi:hypothetical protein Fmac_032486 [Flemingia macrophylla]|uniref:Uncharacterized protein n=1 Tax=Flemingia macrophylla TaxID=520843 RepID=A0ABD1L519_9FABA
MFVVDAESAFHTSVAHFAESASSPVLLHSRTSLADTATWFSATSTTKTPHCGSCWDSRWRRRSRRWTTGTGGCTTLSGTWRSWRQR